MLKKQIYILNVDTLFTSNMSAQDTKVFQEVWSHLVNTHQVVCISNNKTEADFKQILTDSKIASPSGYTYLHDTINQHQEISTKIVRRFNLQNTDQTIFDSQFAERVILIDTNINSDLMQKGKAAGCNLLVFANWPALQQDVKSKESVYQENLRLVQAQQSAFNAARFFKRHYGKIMAGGVTLAAGAGAAGGYLFHTYTHDLGGFGLIIDIAAGAIIGTLGSSFGFGIAICATQCPQKTHEITARMKSTFSSRIPVHVEEDNEEEQVELLDQDKKSYGAVPGSSRV